MNSFILKFLLLLIFIIGSDSKENELSKEAFGFTNFVSENIYTQYNLSKISVLVFLDDNIDKNFLEYARNKNVRTYLTGKYPVDKLDDAKYRSKWFKKISTDMASNQINGLNLDFNYPINGTDVKRDQLTSLVEYLSEQLSNRKLEFSFTVPWSPINKHDTATDGQDYDYVQIFKYVDYVLIKSFHVNSQIFVNTSEYDDDVCLAKSNQGFVEAIAGLMKWLDINDTINLKRIQNNEIFNYPYNKIIDDSNYNSNLRNKIIFVYPWFGLDYTCIASVERQRCLIEAVQNIDSNCSDKIARVTKYSEIMKLVIDKELELLYDPHSRSTYLEFKEKNHVHQLWFDYYYDFMLKYNYVSQFNLRGIGIYALDYLDYLSINQKKITEHMWELVPTIS